MIKKLLMCVFLLGLVSVIPSVGYKLNCFAASDNKTGESPYKGQYSGPYTVEASVFGEQTGKFTLTIDDDGEVNGKAENHTSGRKADISGSVNEDGDIKLILEWADSTYTMKGTVVKTKTGHLKGTLNQYSGREVVATIKMDLPPKKSGIDVEKPAGAGIKREPFDSSGLVGTWEGTITENGYTQTITWQVNADKTDVVWFSSEYGTTGPIRSRWRYVDGVIYEDGPTGSASASVRWIDNNHIELTIIQNQDGLSSRGRTRHYYRRSR